MTLPVAAVSEEGSHRGPMLDKLLNSVPKAHVDGAATTNYCLREYGRRIPHWNRLCDESGSLLC